LNFPGKPAQRGRENGIGPYDKGKGFNLLIIDGFVVLFPAGSLVEAPSATAH
jgi:hypothetical protein